LGETDSKRYWLSVRLSRADVSRYARVLEWYGLVDKGLSRSERFRVFLREFCRGLEDPWGDLSEFGISYDDMVTRPPKWKRRL
jgi:hypothetical protein